MGRQLKDVEIDKKLNGAAGATKVRVAPKIATDDVDKEYDVKECTVEKPCVEEKLEVLGINSSSFDSEDQKTPVAKSRRVNYTVPQPFALATEKRGSCTARRVGVDSPGGLVSPNANNVHSPFKNSLNSPMILRRNDYRKHADDEDNYSIASSVATSVRTSKSVRSRVTVGSAPSFLSSERAEKRKEFYMKLDQKHRAMEEEKSQSEARQKEDQEAAIKQLRKSMVVRAKPVPNFYYEGPPPRVELKKEPLTRPKSPKIGRRKSCTDAVTSSPNEKCSRVCSRAVRHSIGTYMEAPSFSSSPNSKDHSGGRSSTGRARVTPKLGPVPCNIVDEETRGTETSADVTVRS